MERKAAQDFVVDGYNEWEELLKKVSDESDEPGDVDATTRENSRNTKQIYTTILDNFMHPNDGTHATGLESQAYVPDDLHYMPASLERQLLVEPVEHALADGGVATPRQCLMASECLGKSPYIQNSEGAGGGRVLMELMFPGEHTAFLQTGELPAAHKSCVLCMRQHILACYIWSMHVDHQKIAKRRLTINPYVNPVNVPDGYHSDYVIPFANRETACMLGPVAVNRLSEFKWVRLNNAWRVDQSAIEYRQNF